MRTRGENISVSSTPFHVMGFPLSFLRFKGSLHSPVLMACVCDFRKRQREEMYSDKIAMAAPVIIPHEYQY